MSDPNPARPWTMRLAFAGLILLILFFHLLPLQTAAGGLIWPDLILAFALTWSVRRPDYVPLPLLAVMFLLADLLLQRPPGLWAALALVACNQLQIRSLSLRDAGLAAELWMAAAWIVAVGVAYRLILGLTLIEGPALGPALIQIIVTVLAYPLVVAMTHAVMGVRKATPGDLDSTGSRI